MLNKEHIDIPIPVLRYSLAFAGLYFVVLAGFGIVTYFIEFDLGQGANIGALVAALYFAVHLFVQDNGCAPSKTERKRLSWACLLSSVIVSLAIISVLLMFEGQSLLSVLSPLSCCLYTNWRLVGSF